MNKNHTLNIFLLSISSSFLLLIIERYFNINEYYHPDVNTYLDINSIIVESWYYNYIGLFGNIYYLVVFLLNSNLYFLIFINILLFSLTNVILFNHLYKYTFLSKTKLIILILFILNPYRIHLSIHVLKDTMLLLFMLLAVLNFNYSKKIINIVFVFFISARVIFYLPMFFNYKNKINIIFMIVIYAALFKFTSFSDWVYNISITDMKLRDYDLIPNFISYDHLGVFYRSVVWPLLLLSGGFIFFSKSLLFIPLFFGQIVNLLLIKVFFGLKMIPLNAIITIIFFSIIISGFTSYFRYCTPIFTLIPILITINIKKV